MIDGFVLAGGASTRMGVDKARAPFGGRPLAVAAAEGLREVCGRAALVRRADDGLPWRWADGGAIEVVLEPEAPDRHPLWGVAQALRSARTPLVAIVPCDVPGVSRESWARLVADAPSVASDGGRIHPLVAVLPRAWAERAAGLAAAGAGARDLVSGCQEVALPVGELVDRNRPEDLGPGPIAHLRSRLPHLPAEVVARILDGERERLRARGILDPDPMPGLSSPP
ncbi:MAG: NTP transferase domain-containing protein [Alphaproteobacteria bacterium]|nr:NTP transferase domain-containing protein [Alphaproteobacteria bacterium]